MCWQTIDEVVDRLLDDLMAAAAVKVTTGAGDGSRSAVKDSDGTELMAAAAVAKGGVASGGSQSAGEGTAELNREKSEPVPEGRGSQSRANRQSSEPFAREEVGERFACREWPGSTAAEISYPAEDQNEVTALGDWGRPCMSRRSLERRQPSPSAAHGIAHVITLRAVMRPGEESSGWDS